MQELNAQDKFFRQRGEVKNYPTPDKPSWFDAALLRLGGQNSHGMPNLRASWGQDQRVKKWWCGWELFVYHHDWVDDEQIVGADVINLNDSKDTFVLDKKDAQFLARHNKHHRVKDHHIVNFRVQTTATQIGIPRWFTERWQPTDEIGEADWESYRYETLRLDHEDHRQYPARAVFILSDIGCFRLDVLGPCPKPGRYVQVERLETDDATFRPLDQTVIDDLAKHLATAEAEMRMTPEERTIRDHERIADRKQKKINAFNEWQRDMLKNRGNVIFGNPYLGWHKERETAEIYTGK